MKKEEIKRIRLLVKDFLKSNKSSLTVEIKDKNSTTLDYYKKATKKSFFKSLITIFGVVMPASEFKNFLYRITGLKIGKKARITMGTIVDVRNQKLISIGEGTIIGTGTTIITHEATQKKIRIGRVKIGKKVLIGGGCIIRSGITIGDYSVIGAGSFVNRNVKPKEFVGGVPIKRIKMLKKLL
jgi:acetyltransferase-like isoleucine patch superfamily enzyme